VLKRNSFEHLFGATRPFDKVACSLRQAIGRPVAADQPIKGAGAAQNVKRLL